MALGTDELILLAVIALVFLGPKEVYQIAHKLGRWMREIQKMSQEFMRELNREADAIERSERSQSVDRNVFVTGGNASQEPAKVAITEPTVSDDVPESVFSGHAGASDSSGEANEFAKPAAEIAINETSAVENTPKGIPNSGEDS